jgi:excisionase family DNA binding protein
MVFLKNTQGQHRHATPGDVVELIRQLARMQPDAAIVNILNRLGVRTGYGNTWVEARLRSFRSDHSIPAYVPGERSKRGELTLDEAAELLGVYPESVRRLIAGKQLPAQQPCKGAPWIIKRADVEKLAAERTKTGPHTKDRDQLSLKLQ